MVINLAKFSVNHANAAFPVRVSSKTGLERFMIERNSSCDHVVLAIEITDEVEATRMPIKICAKILTGKHDASINIVGLTVEIRGQGRLLQIGMKPGSPSRVTVGLTVKIARQGRLLRVGMNV